MAWWRRSGAHRLKAKKSTRTFRYLFFEPEEHPISAQLFGSDPQVMADAAKACQDFGFDIVDINFGCPVNKVVKCNGGSGLLRDLPLVEEILRKVRAAISIPLHHEVSRRLERPGTGGGEDGAARRRLRTCRPWRCIREPASKATAARLTGPASPK